MKVCQIAIIGENIEWVLKGLMLFPTTKLVMIATPDLEYVKKINEIKKRLQDNNFEIMPLEIDEKLISGEEPIEFINKFKEIIFENYEKGYKIEINATAGLRVWQLLGYFIKIQLKNIITNYFIINKQSGEPFIFPPGIIKKTEQLFLDVISDSPKSIEQIKQGYEQIKGKSVSFGLISKYLSKLKKRDLIQESKKKKLKQFKLSHLGLLYRNNLDYYKLKLDGTNIFK